MRITRRQLRKMIAECMSGDMGMGMQMEPMEDMAMMMGPEEEHGEGRALGDGGSASMARGQLFKTAQKAQSLYDRLSDEDELPEWVQYKITLANEYISTAEDYLSYKIHRFDSGDPLPAYESRYLSRALLEAESASTDTSSAKPGSEEANVKGTLDIKKISSVLGVDEAGLKKAITAAKSGSRSASHNATLADVFVKLIEAQPQETVTVMNVLKKVKESE